MQMQKPLNDYNQSNFIIPLAVLYCMALVIPIVLAYRPVSVLFLSAIPGGAIIFPATYLFGDIISEVYGYRIARQIIWCAIGAEVLFAVAVTAVIYAPHPADWQNQQEYLNVLGHSLRFVFASILGTTLSEFANIYIISKSKIYYQGKFFWFRNLFSSVTGEAILTIIVYSISFLGVLPVSRVVDLMINGYIYKVFFAAICVVPAVLITHYLKKAENLDVYDHATNFNPFIFKLHKSAKNTHLQLTP